MSVREELAKHISNRPCADCGGSRLRPEARNVYIEQTNLPDVSEKSIGEALSFFGELQLNGQKSANRREDSERNQRAVTIFGECRLELSFPFPLRRNLSGGEAQRIRLASQNWCGLSRCDVCIR